MFVFVNDPMYSETPMSSRLAVLFFSSCRHGFIVHWHIFPHGSDLSQRIQIYTSHIIFLLLTFDIQIISPIFALSNAFPFDCPILFMPFAFHRPIFPRTFGMSNDFTSVHPMRFMFLKNKNLNNQTTPVRMNSGCLNIKMIIKMQLFGML